MGWMYSVTYQIATPSSYNVWCAICAICQINYMTCCLLYFMRCVLCALYYVLCTMYYALCAMCSVLCITTITAGAVRSAGYADGISRHELASLIADTAEAEKLFDQQKYRQCAPLMVRLADLKPSDVILQLKAGVCLTAQDKKFLPDGEKRLRKILEKGGTEILISSFVFINVCSVSWRFSRFAPKFRRLSIHFPSNLTITAPTFANAHMMLARNLQRQASEGSVSPRTKADLEASAVQHALTSLFDCPAAPDCAGQAVDILKALRYGDLSTVAARAKVTTNLAIIHLGLAFEPVVFGWRWGVRLWE